MCPIIIQHGSLPGGSIYGAGLQAGQAQADLARSADDQRQVNLFATIGAQGYNETMRRNQQDKLFQQQQQYGLARDQNRDAQAMREIDYRQQVKDRSAEAEQARRDQSIQDILNNGIDLNPIEQASIRSGGKPLDILKARTTQQNADTTQQRAGVYQTATEARTAQQATTAAEKVRQFTAQQADREHRTALYERSIAAKEATAKAAGATSKSTQPDRDASKLAVLAEPKAIREYLKPLYEDAPEKLDPFTGEKVPTSWSQSESNGAARVATAINGMAEATDEHGQPIYKFGDLRKRYQELEDGGVPIQMFKPLAKRIERERNALKSSWLWMKDLDPNSKEFARSFSRLAADFGLSEDELATEIENITAEGA